MNRSKRRRKKDEKKKEKEKKQNKNLNNDNNLKKKDGLSTFTSATPANPPSCFLNHTLFSRLVKP